MTPPDTHRSIADLDRRSSNYLAVSDGCLAAKTLPALHLQLGDEVLCAVCRPGERILAPPATPCRSGTLLRMRTTAALLVTIAVTLPGVAMPHPCEVEVAQMKKDLDAIREAIAVIEAVRPSDNQRQVLAGAKGKYDLELRRTSEAQARCERLVREESPGPTPSPASGVAASAAPRPAPSAPPAAAAAPPGPAPAVPAPAPAPAVVVAPAVEMARPPATPPPAAAAPEATTKPATPCLAGCGKDTDCKGVRICVNGACQDPPSR
jgi:hypothetical protein